jgi:predicted N-formylglutamate amidohydrolase
MSLPDGPSRPKRIEPDEGEAFRIVGGRVDTGLLLLADHASNALPPEYGSLGLAEAQLERHIGYDIGIEAMTLRMAELCGAPAILSRFSRLLIDPNRGPDDPTLVMRIADGALIPLNARIDRAEVAHRLARFHSPYHAAIARTLDAMMAAGVVPVIVSLHSFTPVMKGVARPWHAGVLWDGDPRLAAPLIAALEAEGDIVVGDNEPYDGALAGDTIDQHATARGLANALIEVRQDLIGSPEGAHGWAERLVRLLKPLLADDDMRSIRHYPSRTLLRIRPSR